MGVGRERQGYRRYIPAVVSGGALIFCFPPYDLYPLAWVALVPFLVSLQGMPLLRALKTGMVAGFVSFFGTLYWIYHSINHYGGLSFVPSILIVALMCLVLSLYTGLFAVLFANRINSTELPASLLAPLFWTVLEYARTYALSGFPWAGLGYTQHTFLHLIQISDITGVYGVTFLVAAVNGAVADLFISGRRRQEMPLYHMFPTVAGAVVLVLLLAAAFGYGSYRLGQERPGRSVTVSVVQGNVPQDQKWDEQYQSATMDVYRLLTLQAVRQKPDLVIWPETAVPFFFGYDEARTAELTRFQNIIRTPLLTGAITVKEGGDLANSAVLLNERGELAYAYDKIHLVPFGEYVPLRPLLFFVDKLAVGIGDYAAGEKPVRGSIEAGEFGTLICYEIIFPGLARKFFAGGGDFMVTITNDAWFGETPGPYQHFGFAALRAVENRKPVVRAANTGVSGFVDSNGRVLTASGIFERKLLTSSVRTDTTRTLYSRYGDMFMYVCLLMVVLVLAQFKKK
jgi:apolipoprotein N-acyltransferase